MLRVFLLLCLIVAPAPVFAQDDDFARRLVLAEKMLEIRPARLQLENAVDSYIKNYMFNSPRKDQEIFRAAMLNVMNHKALEKTAVDAYVEVFTHEELEAMVAYYSKPEARSASDKQGQLSAKIGPEVVRMLDQALMRMRTAAPSP